MSSTGASFPPWGLLPFSESSQTFLPINHGPLQDSRTPAAPRLSVGCALHLYPLHFLQTNTPKKAKEGAAQEVLHYPRGHLAIAPAGFPCVPVADRECTRFWQGGQMCTAGVKQAQHSRRGGSVARREWRDSSQSASEVATETAVRCKTATA